MELQDPLIKKADAVKAAGGSQNKLSKQLKLGRSTVCMWGEYLPPLHAYRLLKLVPSVPHRWERVN
jgi:hypothetical protein